MGVGVAFAWGATGYTLGDGARMGPGYFPLALGVLLAPSVPLIMYAIIARVKELSAGRMAWTDGMLESVGLVVYRHLKAGAVHAHVLRAAIDGVVA